MGGRRPDSAPQAFTLPPRARKLLLAMQAVKDAGGALLPPGAPSESVSPAAASPASSAASAAVCGGGHGSVGEVVIGTLRWGALRVAGPIIPYAPLSGATRRLLEEAAFSAKDGRSLWSAATASIGRGVAKTGEAATPKRIGAAYVPPPSSTGVSSVSSRGSAPAFAGGGSSDSSTHGGTAFPFPPTGETPTEFTTPPSLPSSTTADLPQAADAAAANLSGGLTAAAIGAAAAASFPPVPARRTGYGSFSDTPSLNSASAAAAGGSYPAPAYTGSTAASGGSLGGGGVFAAPSPLSTHSSGFSGSVGGGGGGDASSVTSSGTGGSGSGSGSLHSRSAGGRKIVDATAYDWKAARAAGAVAAAAAAAASTLSTVGGVGGGHPVEQPSAINPAIQLQPQPKRPQGAPASTPLPSLLAGYRAAAPSAGHYHNPAAVTTATGSSSTGTSGAAASDAPASADGPNTSNRAEARLMEGRGGASRAAKARSAVLRGKAAATAAKRAGGAGREGAANDNDSSSSDSDSDDTDGRSGGTGDDGT